MSAPHWSCAQTVAPGFRLGWVTAAPAVIQKLVFQLHGISLGACSFTQARGRPVLRFRFRLSHPGNASQCIGVAAEPAPAFKCFQARTAEGAGKLLRCAVHWHLHKNGRGVR